MFWRTSFKLLRYAVAIPSTILVLNSNNYTLATETLCFTCGQTMSKENWANSADELHSSTTLTISSDETDVHFDDPIPFGPLSPLILPPETLEMAQERPSQQIAPPVDPRPDPNRDRFLVPIPVPELPKPDQTSPTIAPPPPAETLPSDPSVLFLIEKIEIIGSSILTSKQIEALIKPLEGREVTLEDLRKVADKITEIYLDQGYITSRALVPEQTIGSTNRIVKIQVIEGRLGEIIIQGNKRVQADYIRSRVKLAAGVPLNTAKLEDQLRLLRVDPLFDNVEASLRAGEKEGESILAVRVTEADPFKVSFNIDNYSPPSVGSERVGVSLFHRNLTGRGDFIFASYHNSKIIGDGDSDVFDFVYSIPINAMNGTIQLRTSPNANEIVQEPFNEFGLRGEAQRYEISYRQPLKRTPIEELAVSIGFTYQKGQTFLEDDGQGFGFGPDDDGVTTTSVIKIGQDYLKRDLQGVWALRSQFTIGTGLFGATTNAKPTPDGYFFSWLGQVQRVQRINENNLLILQGDLQLSANPLLASQQFVIGGGQSLRGYRQNIRSGDNGFRLSAENRIIMDKDTNGAAILQLAPFIDVGYVWNAGDNPNKLPSQRFLASVGVGLIWEALPGLNVRLDYGFPFVDLDDRGENAQDDGFYFSINYTP